MDDYTTLKERFNKAKRYYKAQKSYEERVKNYKHLYTVCSSLFDLCIGKPDEEEIAKQILDFMYEVNHRMLVERKELCLESLKKKDVVKDLSIMGSTLGISTQTELPYSPQE